MSAPTYERDSGHESDWETDSDAATEGVTTNQTASDAPSPTSRGGRGDDFSGLLEEIMPGAGTGKGRRYAGLSAAWSAWNSWRIYVYRTNMTSKASQIPLQRAKASQKHHNLDQSHGHGQTQKWQEVFEVISPWWHLCTLQSMENETPWLGTYGTRSTSHS
jgi:hypothetical protein